MRRRFIVTWFITLAVPSLTCATEPNDTFETATVLPPGVLSVTDSLAVRFPDTVLGVRDHFGFVYADDDDSSPLGDGRASGLGGVPTNSGSIDFVVSGWPDFDFFGAHSESGSYEVFVDVYDFFNDRVASFSEVRLLQPGVAHDFFYSDFNWIGGNYDVYIDNTVDPADVDFLTFTGLTPGAAFTARTLDPDSIGIDTYLGWFDSGGALLEADDDGGVGLLSLIAGIVPANGMLTFAVTGFGDIGFVGDHVQSGAYELELQVEAAGLLGDYNGDNVVDAADYVLWRKSGGNQQGYNNWRAEFGMTAANGSAAGSTAVPEPQTVLLLIFTAAIGSLRRRRRKCFAISAHGGYTPRQFVRRSPQADGAVSV